MGYARKLNMFDGLFFVINDPLLPPLVSILHRPQNNPGYLQARVAQAD